MMKMLRAMREPLKYVQGRDALLQFHKEMGYMGKRWLFVCANSGYKACHDKIEKSFGDADDYRRYEVFGGISSNIWICSGQHSASTMLTPFHSHNFRNISPMTLFFSP